MPATIAVCLVQDSNVELVTTIPTSDHHYHYSLPYSSYSSSSSYSYYSSSLRTVVVEL